MNQSFQHSILGNNESYQAQNEVYYHLVDAVEDKAVVNTINDYDINNDSLYKLPCYITKELAEIISEYPDGAGQSISARLHDMFYMSYITYNAIKDDYEFLPHFYFKTIFLVHGNSKPFHKTFTLFLQIRDEYELGGDILLFGLRDQFDEDCNQLIKM